MNETPNPPEIGDLMNRVGQMIRGLQFSDGLSPTQWAALRFVSRANRYSRNPSALAGFLGATKGTVSQTLIALEGKGYLMRVRGGSDRRVVLLKLTAAGEALLLRDPLHKVHETVASALPVRSRGAVAEGLAILLRGLQRQCNAGAFGVCSACALLSGKGGDGCACSCGLTGDALGEDDLGLICTNFVARA